MFENWEYAPKQTNNQFCKGYKAEKIDWIPHYKNIEEFIIHMNKTLKKYTQCL